MMKERFNKYCAEVMGYSADCANRYMKGDQFVIYVSDYNPYDDLNQMAEAFDNLNTKGFDTQGQKFHMDVFVKGLPIKQAMQDFIISTMPELIK